MPTSEVDDELTPDELTPVDRAALEAALAATLAEDDKDRVAQVKAKLAEDGWLETAEFCAYHRQFRMLALRPWQSPPCWIVDVELADAILAKGPFPAADGSDRDTSDCQPARLTKRMLRAGVSVYDPDPLRALAKAKRRS